MDLVHHIQIPPMHITFRQCIQCTERFIQQSHILRKHIGSQKRSPLAHTSRKLFRILFLSAFEAKLLKKFPGFLTGSFFVLTFNQKRQCYIILNCPIREQQIFLKHITDIPRLSRNIPAVQHDFSLIRFFQSGNHIKQSRLPSAAGTQQTDQFIVMQLYINVFYYICILICKRNTRYSQIRHFLYSK